MAIMAVGGKLSDLNSQARMILGEACRFLACSHAVGSKTSGEKSVESSTMSFLKLGIE